MPTEIKCGDPNEKWKCVCSIAHRAILEDLGRSGLIATSRNRLKVQMPGERHFDQRRGGHVISAGPVIFRGMRDLLVCLGIFACAVVIAHAQSAAKWDKLGHEAEARSEYDAAFEAYRQAHALKPKDLRYQTRYERMRFQDANAHLDRGRVLRQSGDLGGAIAEFSRALQIDKANQSAAQELIATQAPSLNGERNEASAGYTSNGMAMQTPHQKRVKRDVASLEPPVELRPMSDEPLTLHMVEDTKIVYQTIAKIAGLNVIFDADYSSRRIPVDLTNVSLGDALRIVGKIAGTFWSPVTSNTIFVAQNNRSKHTDLDDLAVETFYLTNISQQADSNEVLTALRNLLDPSAKLFLVPSQNAIVIRGTPAELTLSEKLLNDLDRTRSEVVVDVAVLEVSRNLERNLGISLPTSFGVSAQASNANQTSTTTSSTSSSTTSTSGITLNTLANMNGTNFAVTVGSATVNALLSDSDTRVLQNPRVRATDGQQATLKIGSRIPVATGSSTSTLTATAVASTQFTYVDVGVTIEMTPAVHFDGGISLKMRIEISSQTGTQTISGVAEPIISQRVVQQVIQLKDGEPSILAGLLQQTGTKSVTGTPGLGELPFLKYFFSSQDKVQQSDEIVFLLIPHLVRESVLTEENTNIVDTGTSQQIELRQTAPDRKPSDISQNTQARGVNRISPELQPTSASNAASAMIGQLAAQALPVAPHEGSTAAGASDLSSSQTAIRPTPTFTEQNVGSTFEVAMDVSNARDLSSVPLQLQFDSNVLSLIKVDSGEFFSRDGQAPAFVQRDEGNGLVTISATRPPHTNGVSGQGTLFTLTFKALAAGSSTLTFVNVDARDSKQARLVTSITSSVVHVK